MQKVSTFLQLSASDLAGHLNCRHLTALDLAVANGALAKPAVWDPSLAIMAERGARHEQAYIDHLKSTGHTVVSIEGTGADSVALSSTIEAMKSGAQIIVQAALQDGHWIGRIDVLRRVETPSELGPWSYEVIDTKLARETKGGTVLQLCLYSALLAAVQKLEPEFAYVVFPGTNYEPQKFRIADYAAYYRLVRGSLESATDPGIEIEETYPDPKEHCEICRWRLHCDAKRRLDDHLCLVAGISKSQINELKRHAVTTLAQLAVVPLPIEWKPERGAVQSYEKVREQARLQMEGRAAGCVLHETFPIMPGFGLTCLPAPSEGDVFFDLEADPFVDDGGLEFLFGYSFTDANGPTYVADWAFSRAAEKDAFERFVDFVMKRLADHPNLHVYHYAPYEPAALKRLMGRYATRENEIDVMLRSGVFVDLYAIVRHAIRASVESYSIKKLEPLYGFKRKVLLADANAALAKVQACLELGDLDSIKTEDRAALADYNCDDCRSASELRDWLENIRTAMVAAGTTIERPLPKPGDPGEDLSEWQQKVANLIARLTPDVPTEIAERTPEQHARWVLAYILDWHRRENKAVWWEYFRLRDLSVDDLLDERAGLSGMSFVATVGGTAKAPIHRYSFPPQETDLRGNEDLRSVGGEKFGKVEAISLENRTIDIKKRKDTADLHPSAVFAHKIVDAQVLANALMRIGDYVADHGISGAGPYQAARDLLMGVAPRIGGQSLSEAGETPVAAAIRIAPHLDNTVLPIQGPPGAGKTYTGARMICALAKAGQRSGVTANSHKVIRNAIDEVIRAAPEIGLAIQCVQKVSEKQDNQPSLLFTTDNAKALAALATTCHVAAGTAWLWAAPETFEAVDVLFVDEAAQMSLANVLAVSQGAKSIVLLGDPRQLEQPMQGSHPDGIDVSALDHILGSHATIPGDRGLFLEETWRLHPRICSFTSELFYDRRLYSRPGLDLQEIKSSSDIRGSGLMYLPVAHEGNQSSSPEEAETIRALVAQVLASSPRWIDRKGVERPVELADILIIAPYNAQVFELQDRIPGARIGTVDKFQGQEAPIVIYSMTTSSHADAPRGMEFLYSANRLNVATSRAKCICVLVGSPRVFEAECRTPRQMQLANAFCRYMEMATSL
jgi:predicted RecB family nuclease